MSEHRIVLVALALVWREGRLLVTRRTTSVHLAGSWELPGGKLLPTETATGAAVREVLEEVGCTVRARGERSRIDFSYPERTVRLFPIDCEWQSGEPEALHVADFAWDDQVSFAAREFPPANAPLVAELRQRFKPLWTY